MVTYSANFIHTRLREQLFLPENIRINSRSRSFVSTAGPESEGRLARYRKQEKPKQAVGI